MWSHWPYWTFTGFSGTEWIDRNLHVTKNEGRWPTLTIVLRDGWLPVFFYMAAAPGVRFHFDLRRYR